MAKSLFIFIFFSFSFLLDLHRRECGKVSHHKCHTNHCHMIGSHRVMSHDECGKTITKGHLLFVMGALIL